MFGAVLLCGCGSEVAQTAYLPPTEGDAFDCGAPGELVAPADPVLGGGSSVEFSDLVLSSYAAGEGPGVYVLSRDGFRFFLNGKLLAESSAARTPEFVPLTLLPGKNVIGVVVFAERGVPAALVQVDELTRTYATSGSWKVSETPDAGWAEPGFDASGFEAATDYGPIGSRPGCDPSGVFAPGSPAHWIGPAAPARAVALRYEIDIVPSGFASVTGGSGVPLLVTTIPELVDGLADDSAHVLLLPEGITDVRPSGDDIRQQDTCPTACPDGSGTVYTVLVGDETCDLPLVSRPRNDRRLKVGSNKTIVGLGRGAELPGASFEVSSSANVIFRNLAIYDVNRDMIEAGDGIDITAADGVWVDHVTFKWLSDGFTDSRPGTRGLTISWTRYDGVNDAACGKRHPRAAQLSDTEATIHHCLFSEVNARAPLFDHPAARGHLFNNLFSDNADFAVGAFCGAQVLVEGSTFDNVAIPTLKNNCPDAPDMLGFVQMRSNVYADSGSHREGSSETPEPKDPEVFSPPYEYTLEAPGDAADVVSARAGAGGPWRRALALPAGDP